MNNIVPFSPLWFKKRKLFRSAYYFQTIVQETINKRLSPANNSSVQVEVVENGMCKKPGIVLTGSIADITQKEELLAQIDAFCENIGIIEDKIAIAATTK